MNSKNTKICFGNNNRFSPGSLLNLSQPSEIEEVLNFLILPSQYAYKSVNPRTFFQLFQFEGKRNKDQKGHYGYLENFPRSVPP